jgi:hypothetical protein
MLIESSNTHESDMAFWFLQCGSVTRPEMNSIVRRAGRFVQAGDVLESPHSSAFLLQA